MVLAVLVVFLWRGSPAPGAEPPGATDARLKRGEELFKREWKPNDPRCPGGDGLGPVYNATSCVACHGDGGPGGAGPEGMNVEVVIVAPGHIRDVRDESPDKMAGMIIGSVVEFQMPGADYFRNSVRGDADGSGINLHLSSQESRGRYPDGFAFSANGRILKAREFDLKAAPGGGLILSCPEGSITAGCFDMVPEEKDLVRVHPALLAATSVVLHHLGVEPGYKAWRTSLRNRIRAVPLGGCSGLVISGATVYTSERNTPPLFGLGRIDVLSDADLVAAAEQEPASVRGRVNRLKDGRIGRFGWRAQIADLREFVLSACAGELGLEVSDHPQAVSPLSPDRKARGPDLTTEECDALVAYVRALPAPVQLEESGPGDDVEAGRAYFEAVGCADCHRPNLGPIEGIYSDLLLHDMGPELSTLDLTPSPGRARQVYPAALGQRDWAQWRTPPLWGYRDSGPYLHDGRAAGLEEAVKAHGGQARDSAGRFFALTPRRRSQVERFLKSLAAPPSATSGGIAEAKDSAARRRSMLGPATSSAPARGSTTSTRTNAKPLAERERLAVQRLKMAQALEKMGKPQGALVFYREIVREQPGSDAAPTAAARIKALHGEEKVGKDR